MATIHVERLMDDKGRTPAAGDGGPTGEPRPADGAPERETVAGALAGAFRRLPLAARVYLVATLLYIVGMSVWAAILSRNVMMGGPGWATLAGGTSGLLLMTAILFSRVAQDEGWRLCWKWGLTPKRMTGMLLAVPLLTFGAGVCAAVSAVIMVSFLRLTPLVHLRPLILGAIAVLVWGVVAAGMTLQTATRWLYFHAREQAAAAERARAEAADAQLAALQAQVHPHFLFNALNTIAALVRTDPRAAEATTENLARVLRRTLDRTRRTECTVEDEIDFLRAWLSVERARFGSRLRVDFEVDPAAEPLRIPTMTLQPLVENSLKHGIAGKLEGGRVTVRVGGDDGRLRLEVEDDGAGFPREPREGTGLANLRRRLETIYGGAAELRVERPPHGARVVVELPASAGGNGDGVDGGPIGAARPGREPGE